MDNGSKPSPDMSAFERLVIGAAVIGVVAGVVLWLLLEHEEEATRVFTMAIGKAMQWAQ